MARTKKTIPVVPMPTPPPHICVKFSRWTPKEIMEERNDWMMARAKEGHTAEAIAEALGMSPSRSGSLLKAQGYKWWEYPRQIRWSGDQRANLSTRKETL